MMTNEIMITLSANYIKVDLKIIRLRYVYITYRIGEVCAPSCTCTKIILGKPCCWPYETSTKKHALWFSDMYVHKCAKSMPNCFPNIYILLKKRLISKGYLVSFFQIL